IGANILLCIGSCILGCISNFYYDHKHRVSFLETKSSLIIKVNIEQGQLEQERLLLSILPKHVADEMIRHWGSLDAGQFRKIYMSRHEDVSILFADIVGFTAISSSCTAPELVKILNELFANFDRLSNTFRQARIKILGDCYYCVCGASEPRTDHAVLAIHMGLAMVDIIKDVAEKKEKDVNMRVGIHTGAVLAGVLGQKQWQFDVLGKEVTIANKMESSGVPGRVHISHKTKNFLTDEFELEPGNGQDRDDVLRMNNIVTYLVKGVLKPQIKKQLSVLKNRNAPLSSCRNIILYHLNLKEDNNVRNSVTSGRKVIYHLNISSTRRDSFQCRLKLFKIQFLLGGPISMDEVEFYKRLEDTLSSRNEKKSLSQRRSVYMSIWSLWFTEPGVEEMYRKSQEPLCGCGMVGLCCTLTSTFLAKICVLPRSLLVILVYFVGVTLLAVMTIFTWPQTNKVRVRRFGSWLNGSRITRILSSLLCVLVLFVADTTGIVSITSPTYNVSGKYLDPEDPHCHFPPYFVCSICLVLLAVSCIMEFGYLMIYLLSMCFSIFICITTNTVLHDLFDNYDINVSPRYVTILFLIPILFWCTLALNIPSKYYLCGILFTVSVTILLISRYLDRTYRRLFFWKYETTKQKKQVYELRRKNEALIYNILPAHVARDFIGRYRRDDELYSHSYSHIGVMFAACPNFNDFYNESSVNNNGLECLRFLNEIISDYDELLEQPRFSCVCKIKTVGPTYMAASGMTVNLHDEVRCIFLFQNIDEKEKWNHLDKLVQFAFLMFDTLKKINEQSFNNFILRIGINHGPIVAGVIGARKPHYDIWGNTVNVASRMESTGHVSKIQVVEETKNILEMFGYTFEKRGYVFVKGKGDLVTYFIKEHIPVTVMPHQVI
ncbi:hypothetical protein LOTGIDRAFT_142752, partial [Lottia gigantea]